MWCNVYTVIGRLRRSMHRQTMAFPSLVLPAPESIGPITAPLDKWPSHQCITVTMGHHGRHLEVSDCSAPFVWRPYDHRPPLHCPSPPKPWSETRVSSLLAAFEHQWASPPRANRLRNASRGGNQRITSIGRREVVAVQSVWRFAPGWLAIRSK